MITQTAEPAPRAADDVRARYAHLVAEAAAAGRSVAAICDEYSRAVGVSRPTAYRHLGVQAQRTRKRRADAGRTVVPDEQLLAVAKIKALALRKTGRVNMSTEAALRHLARAGIEIAACAGTVDRLLRMRRLDNRSLRSDDPYTQMQSLYANHVHQVDVSNCAQWYLDKGLREADIEDWHPNHVLQKGAKRPALLRYICVDHFSGLLAVSYVYAAGESVANMLDFLRWAWSAKSDGSPFCGVPDHLVCDPGSGLLAAPMRNLCAALHVNLHAHESGKARVKGAVESAHNLWETWFEGTLKLHPARSLAELNEQARVACRDLNASRPLSGTTQTRLQLWLASLAENGLSVTLPPRAELWGDLALGKAETRQVRDNLEIGWKSKRYDVRGLIPCGLAVGDTVTVRPYALDADAPDDVQVIWRDEAIRVSPLALNGRFRADAPVWFADSPDAHHAPHTAREHAKAALEAVPVPAVPPVRMETASAANVQSLPVAARPSPIEAAPVEAVRPLLHAIRAVMAGLELEGVAFDRERVSAELSAAYPHGATDEQIAREIEARAKPRLEVLNGHRPS